MRRLILAILCVPLLLFMQASLLAATSRLSLRALEAEQKRLKDAICAKADADNDDYCPYVCTPRCGCLTEAFIENAAHCEATEPGTCTIESVVAPGQCQASGGTCVVGSSGQFCSADQACLVPGETCVRTCQFGFCISQCRRPCSADTDCPATTATATLSGVTQPDSPDVVLCDAGAGARKINSNDALACLAQIEAVTGPYWHACSREKRSGEQPNRHKNNVHNGMKPWVDCIRQAIIRPKLVRLNPTQNSTTITVMTDQILNEMPTNGVRTKRRTPGLVPVLCRPGLVRAQCWRD